MASLGSNSNSSRGGGPHAQASTPRHAPGPRLQVQRSLSRDTITIHFSALGKEEEDEEEALYGPLVGSLGAAGGSECEDRAGGGGGGVSEEEEEEEEEEQGVTRGLEASEELLLEHSAGGAPPLPVSTTRPSGRPAAPTHPLQQSPSSAAMPIAASSHYSSSSASSSSNPPASSSWPSDGLPPPLASKAATASSTSCSPSKGPSLSSSSSSSSSKPFLSLVRSLSGDVEPRDAAATLPASATPPHHARHRHLMKSFVKSLSTDAPKPEGPEGPLHAHPPPPQTSQSRRNMQLFKQFSQPRLYTGTAAATQAVADSSKTAPSSPLTPTEGRGSFFKVQEVEARIEDTKRRLSEVMSDPLHLFSKIMGDESAAYGGLAGGGAHRSRSLSSSASELSGAAAAALNGLGESNNNNYSIKEEDCPEGEEDETPTGEGPHSVFFSFPSLSSALAPASQGAALALLPLPRSPSLTLGRCSMSALVARQEDEDFCILGEGGDFEACTDTDSPDGERPGSRQLRTTSTGLCSEPDTEEEEEEEGEEEEEEEEAEVEAVPFTALVFLAQVVYCYLVCPVPQYACAVVHGAVAGVMLAGLLLWLSSSSRKSSGMRRRRKRMDHWNAAQLDIQEPGIFKGWMNEISSYDPETYHATYTHSVYVRLEGSVLRLSKPNHNIARRATHNEPKPDVSYISQKIYDLAHSKIHLVPQSLARKRVWNKKYPVCIELAKQEDFMSKAQGERPEAGDERHEVGEDRVDNGEAEEPRRPPSVVPSGGAAGGAGTGGGGLTLFLFGRTGRDKEEWFRRFLLASGLRWEGRGGGSGSGACKGGFQGSTHGSTTAPGGANANGGGGGGGGGGPGEADSRSSSARSSMDEVPQALPRNREPSWGSGLAAGGARPRSLLDYNVYMAKYINPQDETESSAAAARHSPESSPLAAKRFPRGQGERMEPEAWVNALLGRVFWDFLGEKYWANMVSKKIQMKLSKIRLPYFMNELTLKELDMGFAIPKILQASRPSVDHQGLWFDLEISYSGSFLMTLETKMNLARLGKESEGLGEPGKDGPRTYCLADSDEESSSAGSSDEEDTAELLADKAAILPGGEGYMGGHRPSKIMRFVDKIAKSKYFQKATETEFIKKKIEEMSNTPLLLTVEVQECRGTLSVNIPPPPTDRIWYGFRNPPHLELKARPKLGEREVTFANVTDWIEKKLDQEFQKIFVMPNMDDIWLPIMHSAMDPRSNANSVTETNDALTDPEPTESEVSE
ncbi:testis-expressed protein 2 [Gadus macrocephalus]|uniref:testis-expressed protein 2 n=1 Tax=Gadus macrocephalus TaxID=80720 RepID=UPI0028CBAC11|nr:testis-expressed protein 2 [Gadus macrocephalus]